MALQARARLVRPSRLRQAGNQRAPPPSLRIQPRLRKSSDQRRPAHHRPHPRRKLRRNRRSTRTPVVSRLPVPSRIQIQAARAASTLCRLHRRGARAQEKKVASQPASLIARKWSALRHTPPRNQPFRRRRGLPRPASDSCAVHPFAFERFEFWLSDPGATCPPVYAIFTNSE